MRKAISIYINIVFGKTVLRLAKSALVLALLCIGAEAHDPGLSSVEVRLDGKQTLARIGLSRIDAENLAKRSSTSAREGEKSNRTPLIVEDPVALLKLASDGSPLVANNVASKEDESGGLSIEISYPAAPGSLLVVELSIFENLPRGHRQYVAVKDAAGKIISERVLDDHNTKFEVAIERRTGTTNSMKQFVTLGVEHILTGYDHIAFLLALLIVGPAFGSATRIITSFTVAHSITLAAATLGIANIPAAVVEPMIAVSIVYVGVENLFKRDQSWRWLITFGFGLIHGFGFASALRELGIGSNGSPAALPLVSFNVGVELGQIAITSLVLPVVWMLRKRPMFLRRYVPVCSVVVAAAGAFWLVERLLKS